MKCETCGQNEAINDFYRECEGCIKKFEMSKEAMNKMGNVLYSFLSGLNCEMPRGENADCTKCMIKPACWWFLEICKVLDNITDFFGVVLK